MTIKKVKGGYEVEHCHGKGKGRRIGKHRTRAEAEAQHRAIEANRRKRGR